MVQPLPASLRRRSDVESIYEDIEPYVGTSVEERDAIMLELCRFAAEQIAASPRRDELCRYQDPRSPEALQLWRRLVAESRRT